MPDDMVKNCQTVWANCLEVIKQEISEQSFHTWFKPIKPAKLENNVLTLEVPSPFFYEWLEEYYVHLLKKAIDQELGPNGKLEYSIVVDKGKSKDTEGKNQPYTLQVRNQKKPTLEKRQVQPQDAKPDAARNRHYTSPFEIPEINPLFTDSQLNSNYSFDTYIEGDCNSLARSAGLAIAKKPGTTAFNPFVVYGGVGLGKTHLVQAIGNEVKANHPDKFVLYVSSEQFTAQFIEALRNNNVQHFTNYYLHVDVLLVDDIQFLSGKEKTQENFFHIFNRLHQSGRQIIMTSDCPPRNLEGLQERLLSRFKWGLTADVQKPDFETRMAIIQSKMQSEGVDVPSDVMEFLAQNIDSNIRELEGVLISLIANASFMRKEINLDLAKRTLLNIVRNADKEITIDFIQEVISDYFKISVEDLKSKTRKKEIAHARQIAMYFSQNHTKMPLKSIGNAFGGRDHSTVIHASKAVKEKAKADPAFNQTLSELLEQIQVKK